MATETLRNSVEDHDVTGDMELNGGRTRPSTQGRHPRRRNHRLPLISNGEISRSPFHVARDAAVSRPDRSKWDDVPISRPGRSLEDDKGSHLEPDSVEHANIRLMNTFADGSSTRACAEKRAGFPTGRCINTVGILNDGWNTARPSARVCPLQRRLVFYQRDMMHADVHKVEARRQAAPVKSSVSSGRSTTPSRRLSDQLRPSPARGVSPRRCVVAVQGARPPCHQLDQNPIGVRQVIPCGSALVRRPRTCRAGPRWPDPQVGRSVRHAPAAVAHISRSSSSTSRRLCAGSCTDCGGHLCRRVRSARRISARRRVPGRRSTKIGQAAVLTTREAQQDENFRKTLRDGRDYPRSSWSKRAIGRQHALAAPPPPEKQERIASEPMRSMRRGQPARYPVGQGRVEDL